MGLEFLDPNFFFSSFLVETEHLNSGEHFLVDSGLIVVMVVMVVVVLQLDCFCPYWPQPQDRDDQTQGPVS